MKNARMAAGLLCMAMLMPVIAQAPKGEATESMSSIAALVGKYDNKPEQEKKTVTYNDVEYTVYPLKSGKKDIGAAVLTRATGFSGQLVIMVGINADGVICGYKVLQQTETQGWGASVGEWFQKEGKGNIIGASLKEGGLKVTQDGGEVDGITRSTITSRAFLHAVNSAYKVYKGEEPEKQVIQAGGHHGHGGPGGPGMGGPGMGGPGMGGPQGAPQGGRGDFGPGQGGPQGAPQRGN